MSDGLCQSFVSVVGLIFISVVSTSAIFCLGFACFRLCLREFQTTVDALPKKDAGKSTHEWMEEVQHADQ